MQPSARTLRSLPTRSLLAIGISICAFLHPLSCASAGDFRLLDPLDETKVQPIETFVAAEAFKVGNWIGRRTVAIIGLNFAEHFLQAVERQVPAVSLKGWTLRWIEDCGRCTGLSQRKTLTIIQACLPGDVYPIADARLSGKVLGIANHR